MHKLLDRRFVGPVMSQRPKWMAFVQWSIIEDFLVNRTSGDKYELLHTGRDGGLNQLQRTQQINTYKLDDVSFTSAKTRTRFQRAAWTTA